MKQRTKEALGNVFGGLFSNQRVINGAKHSVWWISLIMFVLAVLLPIIPITVNTSSAYGSSFLAGTIHSWDTQIAEASIELYNDGYEFTVRENALIEFSINDVAQTTWDTDTTPVKQVYDDSVAGKQQISFQVFYTDAPLKTKDKNVDTVSKIFEKIIATKYEVGTTTEYVEPTEPATDENEETKYYYHPSFLLIYQEGYYAYLAKPNSTEAVATSGGDWKNLEVNTKLLERVVTVEGKDPSVDTVNDPDYVEGIFNNWKEVYDLGYIYTRNTATLTSTLIFIGVYAGLSFFMGLMIFLLTRGKKNPFSYLKFGTCLKINAWASVSPAILALVLGFMIPSYSMMFFIILHGVRTMWLTSKQLKPM